MERPTKRVTVGSMTSYLITTRRLAELRGSRKKTRSSGTRLMSRTLCYLVGHTSSGPESPQKRLIIGFTITLPLTLRRPIVPTLVKVPDSELRMTNAHYLKMLWVKHGRKSTRSYSPNVTQE